MSTPTLIYSNTSRFSKTASTGDIHVRSDATFYRPIPGEGYYILGDYGQPNYNPANGTVVTVKAEDDADDLDGPLLKPPVKLQEIASLGDGRLRFYFPVPPEGYLSIGTLTSDYEITPADVPEYRCVRQDWVTVQDTANYLWNGDDNHSHYSINVTVYLINVVKVICAIDQLIKDPTATLPVLVPRGIPGLQ